MKSGKDDEKIMGPMFPRLHVNDTGKGGPRAPPRNKMALYEQLSIPSQRFNHGALLLNHPNNTSGLVLPESSTQGSGLERSSHFPLHLPPSNTTYQAERFLARRSEGATLNTPLAQLEQGKNVGDEDDFVVPVFVQSGIGQCHGKTQNTMDREKLTSFRREVRSENEVDLKVSVPSHSARSSTDISTREKIDGPMKEANATLDQEYHDYPVANFSSMDDIDSCLQQGVATRSQRVDTELAELMRDVEKGNVPHPRSVPHSREDHSSPNEPYNDSEYYGDRTCVSQQEENIDKSDDVSEISMVDSISCLDISPDDVVKIIGQKNFWKARRAIANQQRVFAVQVFELHRLIKVQRLIAASPHLLLEDGAFLENSSSKGSPAKKLPSDFVGQPPPYIVKHKYDSEKPNSKMECSAENTVAKTTLSSVKNGSQPSDFGPYVGNLQPAPMATDTKMGPWSFHQSPGHQWLIPVMSPSEGLVYKPYPGPGFMGTVCGGCGPFSPAPLTGDLMNPAYGVPVSHHHQRFGLLPGTNPVGHTYFPPYGMPSSAVEHVNQFAGPGSDGQTGPLSGGGDNFNLQHQSSCNVPKQRKGAISQGVKSHASKDSELQGSTASSPSKRARGVETGHTSEGRDALPLFPMAPVVPETAPHPHDTNQPTRVIKVVPLNPRSATESTDPHPHDTNQSTRVIKVVPHNPRSATESAARIFQSIQEERKQHESV